MSEEVIERVDQLVRKNNIKYKDEQSQKAYEQALKQYERQSKKQLAKSYAEYVKQGNKKAIEKAKQMKKFTQKKKKKQQVPVILPVKQEKKEQHLNLKMTQQQLQIFNRSVEARAQRILQEQQLQKLNKQLEDERKKTKLYQLNQKCKKIFSKSHQRIVSAKNVTGEKLEFLKNMEEKAFAEIHQLDNIINNLVDQANQVNQKTKKQLVKPQIKQIESQKQEKYQNQHQSINQNNQEENDLANIEIPQSQNQLKFDYFNNCLSLNTLIFQKSAQELLSMDYIAL